MENKFNFNLKKSDIYRPVRWSKTPLFKFINLYEKLFSGLFVLTFLLFLYGFITDRLSMKIQSLTLGLSIVLLVLAIGSKIGKSFFESKLKKPKIPASLSQIIANLPDYNLADFLSFNVAKAIASSIDFCRQNKIGEVTSTQVFRFLLSGDHNLGFIFSRALLDIKSLRKVLADYLKTTASESQPEKLTYSADFQASLSDALQIAKRKGHVRIETGDMIAGLAKNDLFFKKILIDNNLKFKDIENLTWWLEDLEKKIQEERRFWQTKNLAKKGSLGRQWAAGFTPTLDRFSIDLSERMRRMGFYDIIGHKKEILTAERILGRGEMNNVLIIGESGSGRKSIAHAIAKKSALGESLPEVNDKRVIQLDLSNLLAQIQTTEEIESVLNTIFQEVIFAGNVILVIDEFHYFVGSKVQAGAMDISSLLAPYLSSPAFPIIAIATVEGFHKNIEQNSSILSLFEKVEVAEISEDETLMLLEDMALRLEAKYKKFVSYSALRDIIAYCSKYLPAIPFPEKAMDLLDEAMVYLKQSQDKLLLSEHIARIITEKTHIPVGKMEKEEKQILLNLESLIHEKIIGQKEAVQEVSTALRRARAEVTIKKGPMGSFLFLGPTGVGKTETAKALADIYFGSQDRMIRLDMSEFQSVDDIPRLLGSPGQEGFLTTQVRKRPFSLILLDEIEKAHPNILNLFLQVLDEGHLTDGLGRKVDFKNSIIIATSNAGYKIILKSLQEKDWVGVKQSLLDFLFEEGTFRPEFINRFDAMVVFKPLTKENLLAIAGLMLNKLKKNLKEKEIELIINEPLKNKIVELGYNPTFGARYMSRVIQDKVENILASAILSGEVKRGSRVEINAVDFKLKIN
jgi:ATP-dependent Clp protease ATP-binding subunit ClpC